MPLLQDVVAIGPEVSVALGYELWVLLHPQLPFGEAPPLLLGLLHLLFITAARDFIVATTETHRLKKYMNSCQPLHCSGLPHTTEMLVGRDSRFRACFPTQNITKYLPTLVEGTRGSLVQSVCHPDNAAPKRTAGSECGEEGCAVPCLLGTRGLRGLWAYFALTSQFLLAFHPPDASCLGTDKAAHPGGPLTLSAMPSRLYNLQRRDTSDNSPLIPAPGALQCLVSHPESEFLGQLLHAHYT